LIPNKRTLINVKILVYDSCMTFRGHMLYMRSHSAENTINGLSLTRTVK